MSQMLDPTFYRSPAEAIAAPPERLAYVAAYDPAGRAKDAMTVLDCDPRPTTARWWAGASCRRPGTSCTTSAGTPAPVPCATRATAVTGRWSGAT
jgi:hypothetical protein